MEGASPKVYRSYVKCPRQPYKTMVCREVLIEEVKHEVESGAWGCC